jgi:hypothetical protein
LAWLILAVLLVIFVLAAGRAFYLLRAAPDYWEANRHFIDQTPPPRLTQLARDIEARLPAEWTRPIGQGDGRRQLRIHFDEVNAWLAVRLPHYLDNQQIELPREVGSAMLTQRDGQLVFAFDYESGSWGNRVASVFVSVDQPETGPVRLGVERLQIGQQTLPAKVLFETIGKGASLPAEAAAVLDQLASGGSVEVPALPVDGHRVAVLRGVSIEPQAVVLDLQVSFTADDASGAK